MKEKSIKNMTGSLNIEGNRFFYKVLNKENFIKEINGYKNISRYFPTPKLLFTSYLNKETGIIFFEYDNLVGKNKGLLVDLFSHELKLNNKFIEILNLYRSVFVKTLKKDLGESSDIFFGDRVKNRLPLFYSKSFINEIIDIDLNGNKIKGNFNKIFKDIELFFSKQDKKWCVISQCDPNDLNITLKPNILDYTAGGYVPLMAEFATFYWYQLAQGNYLSLKYNKKAFKNHKDIYKKLDYVIMKGRKVEHYPSKLRIDFIEEYINIVIEPCFKKFSMKEKKEWYNHFKNYLAMKIIGVFNVSKMSKKDMLLSLGYLQMFYNKNITNPKDLLLIINSKKI